MKQLEQLDGWPVWGKLLVTAGVVAVLIAGLLLYLYRGGLLARPASVVSCAARGNGH